MFQEPRDQGDENFDGCGEYNFSIIPDFVPDNILELHTPGMALHDAFDDLAGIRHAEEPGPDRVTAHAIAQALLEQAVDRYQGYCMSCNNCELIVEVLDMRASENDSVLMLIDASDKFFGVLPSMREAKEPQNSFEKFKNPVRLFVAAMPIDSGDSGESLCSIINAPMFSPAAYSELVEHLQSSGTALIEKGDYSSPQALPKPSILLDRMLAKIEGTLMCKEKESDGEISYSISDVQELKILDAHNFDLTVSVKAEVNDSGTAGFTPTVTSTYRFFATTNRYGFLVVDWRNQERNAEDENPVDRRQAA